MALVHKLGVGTLPSGLNRQHRQGPIPSHVKVELRRTQQKLAETLGNPETTKGGKNAMKPRKVRWFGQLFALVESGELKIFRVNFFGVYFS